MPQCPRSRIPRRTPGVPRATPGRAPASELRRSAEEALPGGGKPERLAPHDDGHVPREAQSGDGRSEELSWNRGSGRRAQFRLMRRCLSARVEGCEHAMGRR